MYYFNSEVYKESYAIGSIVVFDGFPPVLRFPTTLRGPKLATSIYFWENRGVENGSLSLDRYIMASTSLCRDLNGNYLLIKTGSEKIADKLRKIFVVDQSFVTSVLRIGEGADFVFRKVIRGTNRTQIRKGYRFKPIIRLGREELIEDFYNVFAITQTDLGTPVHSKKYISSIIKFHRTAKILVVYFDKIPVSAALMFIHRRTLYHPFTGTINRFKPTGINSVLYWEMIKHGTEMACSYFDMGRSFKGSGNAVYKRTWGSEERQLYFCYYLHRGKEIPKYESGLMKKLTKIWSCFPTMVSKNIGQYFIKRVP